MTEYHFNRDNQPEPVSDAEHITYTGANSVSETSTIYRGPSRGHADYEGYRTERWKRMRRAYLAEHPYCEHCGALAVDLDHIIPHRGDSNLFWSRGNWQGLCKGCHSRKTAREDGGFGNPSASDTSG